MNVYKNSKQFNSVMLMTKQSLHKTMTQITNFMLVLIMVIVCMTYLGGEKAYAATVTTKKVTNSQEFYDALTNQSNYAFDELVIVIKNSFELDSAHYNITTPDGYTNKTIKIKNERSSRLLITRGVSTSNH